MALDPSIALGVRPIELPNQLAQYGQLAAIQNAQNQNALAQYQLGSAQRAEAKDIARTNALTSAGTDDAAIAKALLNSGDLKGYSDFLKTRRETEKATLDLNAGRLDFVNKLKRDLSANPSDENIIAFGQDALLQGLYTKDQVERTVADILKLPFADRANALSRMGATAGDLKPTTQVVNRGGSSDVVQVPAFGGKPTTVGTYAITPLPTDVEEQKARLAQVESSSMRLQRELKTAIENNAPPAVIRQLQSDIRNLHPGLAMQNVTGVDENGRQVTTRFAGAGGGPAGRFVLNQSPPGTARAMLGLNETDSALLFGPGGPVESGQIPVNKLNASNAKMYVAAIKANPTLNLATLTEDQLQNAAKARAQGTVQGRQVLTLVDRDTAKNIANGNIPPLTGPNSTKIMNEVMAIKPDYSASDYGLQTSAVKAFNQGVQGNKVRSLNVVSEHFNTLEKAADALQSGDVRAINNVAQFIQTQTGKPAPATFNAVKEILADEIVASVVPGTGALADRVALKKTILAASSPEQLKSVVSAYKELIGGQLNGLEQQYKAGTNRTDFKTRYLTSGAIQSLTPATPAAANVDASNPLMQLKLK